jgi:hypothetical protein
VKNIASALGLAFCLSLSSVAIAQPASATVAPGRGYGTAGCGLGSIVFGNKPGITQVFASTTNGTFGTQTFGITSGTSNCVDAVDPVVQTTAFVETNRDVLAKDIARGNGETIATLSTLAGCQSAGAVGPALQGQFGAIFPSAGVSDRQVSSKVVAALRADASLGCRKL